MSFTPVMIRPARPMVVDDDDGIITVMLVGRELRGWAYENDTERRVKMQRARDYVEGWCDAVENLFSGLDALTEPGTS